MNPVLVLRARRGFTQAQLAARAGTSQPTVAAYEADSKSPTLRTLRQLARACDLEAHVVFVPALTREDRRSLFLHVAISRRIVADPEVALMRARRNLRTMANANPGAAPLLREWRRIIDNGIDRVLYVLADPGEHARELRQVTPFAGILSAADRQQVYRAFRELETKAA
ncbi:MAG: helix-turn-helix transcriptional regulator [Actinomycetota bacterium]|nr:helix-turn-helix transcriptional regulator [Actinomycetota bacterium]